MESQKYRIPKQEAAANSDATKAALAHAPIHDSWVSGFRTTANDRFFRKAIKRILHMTCVMKGARALDAGCGSGTKTILLAEHDLEVTGADFSDYVLDRARAAAAQLGVANRVEFRQEDLLALSFESRSFLFVLCWGVVMHIPHYKRALDELVRVVEPGGCLVLSEGNMYSIQSLMLRGIKRLLGRQRAEIVSDDIGLQFWEETASGRLMTRQTNMGRLIKEVESRGLQFERRIAGQFSELYMVVDSPLLKWIVHAFNSAWFAWIRSGRLAYGNLLVFRRPAGN